MCCSEYLTPLNCSGVAAAPVPSQGNVAQVELEKLINKFQKKDKSNYTQTHNVFFLNLFTNYECWLTYFNCNRRMPIFFHPYAEFFFHAHKFEMISLITRLKIISKHITRIARPQFGECGRVVKHSSVYGHTGK